LCRVKPSALLNKAGCIAKAERNRALELERALQGNTSAGDGEREDGKTGDVHGRARSERYRQLEMYSAGQGPPGF
jgi:hypothetical protein